MPGDSFIVPAAPVDTRRPTAAGETRPAGSAHGTHDVTQLLRAWGAGNTEASDDLVRLVYAELRRQAQLVLRRENEGHTLQPTALVHEAWLRLGDQYGVRWESRTHFFALAAQMMRRVLIDHARTRQAAKRGGGEVQVSLSDADGVAQPGGGDGVDLLALADALERLAAFDPRKAQLVDLRYFAGLSVPEVAAVLGISAATVGREWAVARLWLKRELDR